MSIDHPARLLIGIFAVALFASLYNVMQRRATSRDLAYSDVAFFIDAMKPRYWIPATLQAVWVLAFLAVVLGASGPRLAMPVPVRDGSVFICIDTSGSMATADVLPTRFQAAKAAARAFIEESPSGTRIGIISFAGVAGVVRPLSSDHQGVITALDDVPLPNGATAIGDALKLAAQLLPQSGHRVVILITDGVNNSGSDPMEMAQWLGAHHVRVYTVGIGTPNGGLIPGTTEEATIDEEALRAYASASGGAYARAENAMQLHNALARLGRVTSFQRQSVDASLGFAIGGAIGMLAAFLVGFGLGRYP